MFMERMPGSTLPFHGNCEKDYEWMTSNELHTKRYFSECILSSNVIHWSCLQALETYGSDKPDLRVKETIIDISTEIGCDLSESSDCVHPQSKVSC